MYKKDLLYLLSNKQAKRSRAWDALSIWTSMKLKHKIYKIPPKFTLLMNIKGVSYIFMPIYTLFYVIKRGQLPLLASAVSQPYNKIILLSITLLLKGIVYSLTSFFNFGEEFNIFYEAYKIWPYFQCFEKFVGTIMYFSLTFFSKLKTFPLIF